MSDRDMFVAFPWLPVAVVHSEAAEQLAQVINDRNCGSQMMVN